MSVGYYDEVKKVYVKTAGNLNILDLPLATEISNGIMFYEDKKKLDEIEKAKDAEVISLFDKNDKYIID